MNSLFAFIIIAATLLATLLLAATPASAQQRPILLRDSFPIGAGGEILCQVQDRSLRNPARQTMFDRNWQVVCRDSARPVGAIYSFEKTSGDATGLIAPYRREAVTCASDTVPAAMLAGGTIRACTVEGTELGWNVLRIDQGDKTWLAEGFAAYDSATLLALRSLLANRIVEGPVDIATTSVSDPFSFARIQAQTLEPQQALAEGYRRNLSGEYAEAAAYFETLQNRFAASGETPINPGEFFVNRGLQKSNLGDFAEADRLFRQAAPLNRENPIAARLQRNFEAIHFLNQGATSGAIERLDRPVGRGYPDLKSLLERLEITEPIAARLNSTQGDGSLLGFVDELGLSDVERAQILDAQALQLRGTALRLQGDDAAARLSLLSAYSQAVDVRDGRVTSIARLRAQVLSELAALSERAGSASEAEAYLRNAIDILEAQYPDRKAVSGMQARLGALLLRNGNAEEGSDIYRSIIGNAAGKSNAATGFTNQLAPYFTYLAGRVGDSDEAASDFFTATQVLVRPGVAETQAVLARELSARSSEASRLFRQSTDLARDIERLRVKYIALGRAVPSSVVEDSRTELAAEISGLEAQQLRTQAQLAEFPQYRVVAARSLSLADFRNVLGEGEAYARLAIVAGRPFIFYTDSDTARAYRLDLSEDELDEQVDALRASISVLEDNEYVTYPYDIEAARALYASLFGPVADRLAAADHLIFEPDGALLRLPLDILVTDDASVESYIARSQGPEGDPFDFTGVNWMARDTRISTAVSAQAFVDARKSAPSAGTREYLGLGGNAPLGANPSPFIRAQLASDDGLDDRCAWGAGEWNKPIDTAELRVARGIIGEGRSQIITGAEFTDRDIKGMAGIDQFRVIHFATHGLVTAPAPACPARPALLTSFASDDSDGLLSFDEIFDLDLDADLVILSACDTAGKASIQATREAGVGSGGGTALDGLVRSFIGAGGRSVMASHWPAPDDFNATQRLMNEMFRAGQNRAVGAALRTSQMLLMDEADTSHPFYWGGFAIIGDAERPLLSGDQLAAPDVVADGISQSVEVGE